MQLSAHFTLAEFQQKSNRQLTGADVADAKYFATQLLEPLHRAMTMQFGKAAIIVTSFIRAGAANHGSGDAVDISVPGNDPAKLEWMFQWLATHKPHGFGQLIHERDHLHITKPGFKNIVGEVLREPKEGSYVLASIVPISAAPLLLLFGWWLLFRKRRTR